MYYKFEVTSGTLPITITEAWPNLDSAYQCYLMRCDQQPTNPVALFDLDRQTVILENGVTTE